MKKLIVLTAPEFLPGETRIIPALLEQGADLIHLRKPDATAEELAAWLDAVPARLHPRIVLHDHFALADRYRIGGLHLNARNAEAPAGYCGSLSRSCHSLAEVAAWKPRCRYVFLSPVYDSISKTGYTSAFAREELELARQAGILDDQVIGLGGIGTANLAELLLTGFGGAALLGTLWKKYSPEDPSLLIRTMQELRALANRTCPPQRPRPVVLTVAGSDSSGGAGIQADIKAISAAGAFAASAITAVTAQHTLGVNAIHPVPLSVVRAQLDAVFQDLAPEAVKIGMVNDPDITDTIAAALDLYRPHHVVYDPVMVSTSGSRLMEDRTVGHLRRTLIPRCDLLTPNLQEAEILAGMPIRSLDDMETAARRIAASCREECGRAPAVLVKGGHLEIPGQAMTDVLCDDGQIRHFPGRPVDSPHTHGTGCTLSSAIAARLALGLSLADAVADAKAYVTRAIEAGRELHIGRGRGPLWHQ